MQKLRNLLGPLRVVDAVNRAGGVSRAAEELHITPGAVSHQIKLLESSLGVELFIKSGRTLVLTDAGEHLASRLADLFDRVEVVVAETIERSHSERLRVKVSPTFAVKWLMPRLARFYELQPDIGLDIATTAREEDVYLDNADFVVRHGDGAWPDVHAELLYRDSLVPVCSPRLADSLSSISDIARSKLIHSMRRQAAWSIWFASVGLPEQPPRSMLLANMILCIQAAADGLGVAIIEESYLAEDLNVGRIVVPLQQVAHPTTGHYLVCDPAKADLKRYRAFREWIKSMRCKQ